MRYLAYSNCCTRFCRPLPSHSVKVPFSFCGCKDKRKHQKKKIFSHNFSLFLLSRTNILPQHTHRITPKTISKAPKTIPMSTKTILMTAQNITNTCPHKSSRSHLSYSSAPYSPLLSTMCRRERITFISHACGFYIPRLWFPYPTLVGYSSHDCGL